MTAIKTYTKTKNEKPFDWNKFLNKKKYSLTELYNAEYLSANWVTCACGNQCSIIDRDEEGIPLDDKLENLGAEFSIYVSEMYKHKNNIIYGFDYMCDTNTFEDARKKAVSTLSKIEKRSQILINKKLDEYKKLLKEFGVKKL